MADPTGTTPQPKITRTWEDQAWLMTHAGTFFHTTVDIRDPTNKFSIIYAPKTTKVSEKAKVDAFLSLTPKQLSLLQPYFRLTKLTGAKGSQPYLPKFFQSPYETATKHEKLDFTNIESVSIERLEKYEEEVNLRISLSFFASSYKAFTTKGKDASGKETAALIDFIRRNVKEEKSPTATRLQDHSIKLEVGWNVPTGAKLAALVKGKLLSDKESKNLVTFAQNSRMSLLGTLLHHNINLESDGSMTITMDFLGLLDSFFSDPRGNALFVYNNPTFKILQEKETAAKKAKTEEEKKKATEEFRAVKKKYVTEAYREVLSKIIVDGNLYRVVVPTSGIEAFWNFEEPAGDKPSTMPSGSPTKVNWTVDSRSAGSEPKGTPKVPPSDQKFEDKTIEYFSLDSLINIFVANSLSKIYDNEPNLGKTGFQFGEIIFSNVQGKLLSANIGALPISLPVFQEWFLRYISGKGTTIITLRKFLFDLIQTMVATVFSKKFTGVSEQCELYRPQFQMYGDDTHFYVTANNVGSRTGDNKINVLDRYPKFVLGGSQAVIKTFSFSRVDLAKFAEARIYEKDVQETGIAREMYNVTIDTYGNPFFKNGMYIMIDPSGFVSKSKDSVQLGLGGIYVTKKIDLNWSAEDFTTRIDAIYESPLPNTNDAKYLKNISALKPTPPPTVVAA